MRNTSIYFDVEFNGFQINYLIWSELSLKIKELLE